MIDPHAFRVHEPESKLLEDVVRSLDRGTLTNADYLIFNPAILGYSFASKTWG